MKILHTSDWHLGKKFNDQEPLIEFQAAFLDWLVDVVRDEAIDLVIVAGDLFDRAYPPQDAIRLFRDGLRRIRDARATSSSPNDRVLVAAIAGNHDSQPERVAPQGSLVDVSGVYIRGGYDAVGEVIALPFADGPLDLVLLPYLDPIAAPDVLGEGEETPRDADEAMERRSGRTHEMVLGQAVRAAWPRITSPRHVVISHAFVIGCQVTDSEKPESVGGAAAVRGSLFAPFSYAALGHLHRPQIVDENSTIRYSGTPLAYSFSEEHDKSVTVIDLAADGSCRAVQTIPIPIGRRVMTIKGTMDDLLTRPAVAGEKERFVRAIVTDTTPVPNMKARLRDRYPHIVQTVLMAVYPVPSPQVNPQSVRNPGKLSRQFWEIATGSVPDAMEQELLDQAIRDARLAIASRPQVV